MIGNLEDYNYFVDQGVLWHNYSRLDENITHIVRKGVFMQDDETGVEDIILSLCGMYLYREPNLREFNIEWYNSWVETEACEKCFGIVNKREFQKWLITNDGKEILEEIKENEL